ncbi:uncharacterized protein LOC142597982 [Dermatophagoides farinae]|uniref:uncharacterized protein LOC142597982 n=1 Tax=Dermatophagoides farinae TaxID=6954 RepID=UPI003F5FCB7E
MTVKRIVKAIKFSKAFKVYIVIPLYSEGIPGSSNLQEILHWQYHTLRYMFKEINRNLRLYKSSASVEDYLRFFFLGKIETPPKTQVPQIPAHQIYVHSKLMIIDDYYCLIGSGNINDRSLNGSRDTELSVGISQAYFTPYQENGEWALPKADIYGFRVLLWVEHFGEYYDWMDNPGFQATWDKVVEIATENYKAYLNPEIYQKKNILLS